MKGTHKIAGLCSITEAKRVRPLHSGTQVGEQQPESGDNCGVPGLLAHTRAGFNVVHWLATGNGMSGVAAVDK